MIKKILGTIILIISIVTMNYNLVFAGDPDDPKRGYITHQQPSSGTPDSIIKGADDFLTADPPDGADSTLAIDEGKLISASSMIYNVVLSIAIILAVVIGIIIGIRFMLASTSEKAEIKELLVPYVMGTVVVFGAMGIWKLAVNIFASF